jgi:hypothetical protein
MNGGIGTLVAALFTIATLSSVFAKKNPAFEVAQPIFLGVAAGHAFVVNVEIIRSGAASISQDWTALIPVVLGALVLTRLVPKWSHLSRVSLAIIGATGAALGLRGALQAEILDQVKATLVSLTNLDNIILVVGVISTLAYFLFSKKVAGPLTGHGPLRYIPEVGKIVMMIAFGASFGNSTMGRLSLLIGRVAFLIKDWLGIGGAV